MLKKPEIPTLQDLSSGHFFTRVELVPGQQKKGESLDASLADITVSQEIDCSKKAPHHGRLQKGTIFLKKGEETLDFLEKPAKKTVIDDKEQQAMFIIRHSMFQRVSREVKHVERPKIGQKEAAMRDPGSFVTGSKKLIEARLYKGVSFVVLIVNIAALMAQFEPKNNDLRTFFRTVLLVSNLFFLLETGLRGVSDGLARHFLDILNLIQSFSIIFGFIAFFDMNNRTVIAIFENFRVFYLIQFNSGLKRDFYRFLTALIKTYEYILILFAVLLVFALFGMFFFKTALESRCRESPYPEAEAWNLTAGISALCGATSCPSGSYCGNLAYSGLPRDKGEYEWDESLFYGVFNFDDLFQSVLPMVVYLGGSGWTSLNDMFWKYENKLFTGFFSVCLVFFISVILVNLVVAGFYANLLQLEEGKEQAMNFSDLNSLKTKTIKEGPSSLVFDLTMQKSQKVKKKPISSKINKMSCLFSSYFVAKPAATSHFRGALKRKSLIFAFLSYLMIFIDTLVLCLDSNRLHSTEVLLLTVLDFICLVYFFAEVVFRLVREGRKFLLSFTNLIDSLLFVLNLSTLIYVTTAGVDIFSDFDTDLFYFYSVIRSFQIARIYRLLVSKRLWAEIATMAIEMMKILKKLSNFLIILGLFLLMTSIIGRNLFINAEINPDLGNETIQEEISRLNLKSISNSMITNLVIFLNEDWNVIMINHMKAYGSGYSAYFLVNVLLLTIFFNKFFLALLINQLIESKEMKKMIRNTNPFKRSFDKLKLFFTAFEQKIKEFRNKNKEKNEKKAAATTVFIANFMKNNAKTFDKFMFFVCCFSLVLVALNDPFQSGDSLYNGTLRLLDIPVMIIFVIEVLFLGVSEENGFLSQKTLLRIIICLIYILYFSYDLRILKLFVTFRFILIIQLYKGLKRAVKALILSLWNIFQSLVFFFLFILLFAAIGVKMYKGALASCQGLKQELFETIVTRTDCFDNGGDWVNPDYHFDDIISAMNLLFVVANSSGWLDIMYNSIDSVGPGLQPIFNRSTWRGVYFVLYGIVAHFFVLNIIIAVFVEKYIVMRNKLKAKIQQLNAFQREFIVIRKMILKMKPNFKKLPKNRLRLFLYHVLRHNTFQKIIIMCTYLNLSFLVLFYSRIPSDLQAFLCNFFNYFFTFILFPDTYSVIFNSVFAFELFLKFMSFPGDFFFSAWNLISFTIIASSVGSLYLYENMPEGDFLFLRSFFLAMQLLRICLVFKDILFLKRFFLTLRLIIFKSTPIISLFFLVVFFFSLIGVYNFAYLKPQESINDDINFRNVLFSMFSLFRVATSERWLLIIADASRQQSFNFVCYDISNYSDYLNFGLLGCGSPFAPLFFYSFYLIILLVLNSLVGIMINVSSNIKKQEERAVNLYQLHDIRKLWEEYDTEGSGYMNYKDFWRFSSRIAKILGMKYEEFLDVRSKRLFLKILDLTVYEEDLGENRRMFCFAFHDVVLSLSRIAVLIKLNLSNMQLNLPEAYNSKIKPPYSLKFKRTQLKSEDIGRIMQLHSNIRHWKKQAQQKIKANRTGNENNSVVLCSLNKVAQEAKMKFFGPLRDENAYSTKT